MIDENHIEKFISQLQKKGYTGNFFAPGVENKPLPETLGAYLRKRLADGHLTRAFPFWMSTIIDGELKDPHHTICLMRVTYHEQKGLAVDKIKVEKSSKMTTKASIERNLEADGKMDLPDCKQALLFLDQVRKETKHKRPRL